MPWQCGISPSASGRRGRGATITSTSMEWERRSAANSGPASRRATRNLRSDSPVRTPASTTPVTAGMRRCTLPHSNRSHSSKPTCECSSKQRCPISRKSPCSRKESAPPAPSGTPPETGSGCAIRSSSVTPPNSKPMSGSTFPSPRWRCSPAAEISEKPSVTRQTAAWIPTAPPPPPEQSSAF